MSAITIKKIRAFMLLMPESVQIQSRPWRAGYDWLWQAADLFKLAPWAWVRLLLSFALTLICLQLLATPIGWVIPVLPEWIVQTAGVMLTAGMMLAAQRLESKGVLQIRTLWVIFLDKDHAKLKQMFYASGIYVGLVLVGTIVAFVILLVLGFILFLVSGVDWKILVEFNQKELIMGVLTGVALLKLITFAIVLPAVMAFWFCPPLIELHRVDAFTALKLSFKACYQNIGAFCVNGLVLLGLLLLLIVPMVALLALLPEHTLYRPILALCWFAFSFGCVWFLMTMSLYTAHRDIFIFNDKNDAL